MNSSVLAIYSKYIDGKPAVLTKSSTANWMEVVKLAYKRPIKIIGFSGRCCMKVDDVIVNDVKSARC